MKRTALKPVSTKLTTPNNAALSTWNKAEPKKLDKQLQESGAEPTWANNDNAQDFPPGRAPAWEPFSQDFIADLASLPDRPERGLGRY